MNIGSDGWFDTEYRCLKLSSFSETEFIVFVEDISFSCLFLNKKCINDR